MPFKVIYKPKSCIDSKKVNVYDIKETINNIMFLINHNEQNQWIWVYADDCYEILKYNLTVFDGEFDDENFA